ncbi:hypothetical protein ERO13_D13G174900v2 [Gossypium hirsutum]|uniref:Uncharacterized protein isoform X3 n=2 Tax=Gossypium TaxID=3633 RepID=A0A1U8KTD8_GOSHI|nr:uncharacterized protein LOC107920490 isoform X3 [Gossypium hirsutum]KAB1996006.1 hypothetical protein ES319_D13G200600v1 [Gossypium barbadense]KAG4112659.1 hypothetical protein ERO13_D13G174900v2 [Gossypium hirsutum]
MMKYNGLEATTKVVTRSLSSPLCDSKTEQLQRMRLKPPPLMIDKKFLYKQLSMFETSRRRQILRQERKKEGIIVSENGLTDEDLYELKGCIELGFGFNEEAAQKLCNTLPALDLYFAVNRQLPPLPSPQSQSCSPSPPSVGYISPCVESPRSELDWKIYISGDNPQQVKTKLRHWAQAVACSLMQSC